MAKWFLTSFVLICLSLYFSVKNVIAFSLFSKWIFFFFFFGDIGDWIQDFMLARQAHYHLNHITSLTGFLNAKFEKFFLFSRYESFVRWICDMQIACLFCFLSLLCWGTLWHFQKLLQCIIIEFILSIILPFPHSPYSWNSFNRSHFFIYIHVYTILAPYSSSYSLSSHPPPSHWYHPPR
jgi:hypothetical protein